MFNEKNKLCYFLIFILVLSIILITRKYNKDANNILIPSIIISFLIMCFNKDLGLFILVLSFVMFFVLQNNCKTENFGSESLEPKFDKYENAAEKTRNTELAKTITDKFMNKLNTQLIGLNQLITDNQKYIKTASDNYTKSCANCFTNTKIPEQIKENFPRGNVPDIKNVAFKQTKHNYVTCIKDNEKIHSYGEPLDNPNYSNEEINKLGVNFYPLNK